MKVVSFELSGSSAFFRRPDTNKGDRYFTFSHIHKVALLGMLGSVIELGGYAEQGDDDEFPEFYSELNDINVSIVPLSKNGYFNKKIQVINNATGFASKEDGGILNNKEQWLENPVWKVYVEYSDVTKPVLDSLLNGDSKGDMYLGRRPHLAFVRDVRMVELGVVDSPNRIDSLYKFSDDVVYKHRGTVEFFGSNKPFYYEERLPGALSRGLNHYIYETMVHSNFVIKHCDEIEVFNDGEFNIVMF